MAAGQHRRRYPVHAVHEVAPRAATSPAASATAPIPTPLSPPRATSANPPRMASLRTDLSSRALVLRLWREHVSRHKAGIALAILCTVAVAGFTALRLPEQVGKFGQSALNVGLSKTEVIEAIIQTAPYTGFPPALNALGALSAAFA